MKTDYKRSKELQAKIDLYNSEVKKREEQKENITQWERGLQAELSAAKQVLEDAMKVTIANPSAKNRAEEAEARRKVRELGDELSSIASRRDIASSKIIAPLYSEILNLASEEAYAYHSSTVEGEVDKVIAAREAYLQTLIDYREYEKSVPAVVRQVCDDIGAQVDHKTPMPHLKEPNYYGVGYSRRIGITEHDINTARREGKLLK